LSKDAFKCFVTLWGASNKRLMIDIRGTERESGSRCGLGRDALAPWPARPFIESMAWNCLELRIRPLHPQRRETLAGIKSAGSARSDPRKLSLLHKQTYVLLKGRNVRPSKPSAGRLRPESHEWP
jgi:hypothetical protein